MPWRWGRCSASPRWSFIPSAISGCTCRPLRSWPRSSVPSWRRWDRVESRSGWSRAGSPSADAYVFHAWGLAPVAGALTLMVMGLVLSTAGWRLGAFKRIGCRQPNYRARPIRPTGTTQLALRQAAAQLSPESGRVLTELAQTHLDRFEEQQAQWKRNQYAVTAAQLVVCGSWSSVLPLPGGWGQPIVNLAAAAWTVAAADAEKRLVQEQLVPALQAYLQARDVCPLMARPHGQLAGQWPYLQKADPRIAYIDRAKRLVTNDAGYWLFFGFGEFLDGHKQRAAQSWRRSLEVSDQHLPEILGWGRDGLGPKLLAEEVLPNRPELLVTVAEQLYPDPKDTAQRRPLLEKALAVLVAAPGLAKAPDVFLKGRVLTLLGRPVEATAAYRQALSQEPRQAAWHLELAKLLRTQGQLAEAREELFTVLLLQPDNTQANELLAAVNRELEKG